MNFEWLMMFFFQIFSMDVVSSHPTSALWKKSAQNIQNLLNCDVANFSERMKDENDPLGLTGLRVTNFPIYRNL